MHLGSDYDFECTLQELSDNGATFEGKIEWNGDWVLKFMVPLDLSGPETQGLHSSLQTKKKSHFIHVCMPYNANARELGQIRRHPNSNLIESGFLFLFSRIEFQVNLKP